MLTFDDITQEMMRSAYIDAITLKTPDAIAKFQEIATVVQREMEGLFSPEQQAQYQRLRDSGIDPFTAFGLVASAKAGVE